MTQDSPVSTPGSNDSPRGGAVAALMEQHVRSRIDSLSYLPITAAVAMRFVELGRDLDADPNHYVKIISADCSLSSKLLALANSSWFGVRNRVTKLQVAVNLLGLGTVRTLAISYCLTGLHNDLRLSPDEARMFWSASLCKAVAAKQYAAGMDNKLAEEAFTAALFQDFGLPVMFVTARQTMGQLLECSDLDAQDRLERERAIFRLDHAEFGRAIAQKLELPELFVDAVGHHHSYSDLAQTVGQKAILEACYVAGLFPHILNAWNRQDAEEMERFLHEHRPDLSAKAFLDTVQKEFVQLYTYFEPDDAPEIDLRTLLEAATAEAADNTTRLVGVVQQMMQQMMGAGRSSKPAAVASIPSPSLTRPR